jgi:hypothetical protein
MQPLQVGTDDVPMSGGIPYAVGQASMIRIPIPGQRGLCIELSARNFKGTSTSTIFFQDVTGKKNLRLDYGYNKVSKVVDYHWNQKSVFTNFGIADHTTVGQAGRLAYGVAKYFRYAGRLFVVAGVALDVVSVVRSSRPLRRASQAVAGWAGAWAGCKVVGAGGAWLGTGAGPLGTAAGGIGGCIIGGAAGYFVASETAGVVYDWAEDTVFVPLMKVPAR